MVDRDMNEPAPNATTAELLRQMSDDTRRLIKDEIGLARLEVKTKAKQTGLGIGLFGVAGIVALFGFGAMIATAIIALALVVDAWLAALIVTVVLFLIAGVSALVGKKEVSEGTPPTPAQAVVNVKKDVNALKGSGHE